METEQPNSRVHDLNVCVFWSMIEKLQKYFSRAGKLSYPTHNLMFTCRQTLNHNIKIIIVKLNIFTTMIALESWCEYYFFFNLHPQNMMNLRMQRKFVQGETQSKTRGLVAPY